MTAESQAAADILTGALVASSVEPDTGASASPSTEAPHGACRNCGATLGGSYCASCGQAAHIHRSFWSLGHDILHSVFHLDGKFWRTMPELAFHPGRLTRRYIEGERAKFISPMALFLFAVFLMYGVFALFPDADYDPESTAAGAPTVADFRRGSLAAAEVAEERIEDLRGELDDVGLSAAGRAELEREIRGLESSRAVMQAIANGDWARLEKLREESETLERGAGGPAEAPAEGVDENAFRRALERVEDDPALVLYKMKSNGYKFSWLLVPLSVPFVWLLFFWRREFRLYDHAVFVTYSISFMTLLVAGIQVADALGAGGGVLLALSMLVPPLHIYKQLRGAYRLSRLGAFVRLAFVLFAAAAVLTAFLATLFLLGALE